MTTRDEWINIEESIEQLRPTIEQAYSHVWDSMSPLLLMRTGKDEYRYYTDKEEYLEREFKSWKMRLLKLWHDGKIAGIEHRVVLTEEEE